MATFGNTTIGASESTNLSADYIRRGAYVMPENGEVTSISVYAKHVTGSNKGVRGAIYNTSGELIASTNETIVSNGVADWVVLEFSSPVTLDEGTTYWLTAYFDWTTNANETVFFFDSGSFTTDARTNGFITYPTFPDPWSPGSLTSKMSLFATYTPTQVGSRTSVSSSNHLVGGTASATNDDFGAAGQAFDRILDSPQYWGGSIPGSLKYDLGASNEKIVNSYHIYGAPDFEYMPKAWTFEGSNNDSDWTALDTRTGRDLAFWTSAKWYVFTFTNQSTYRYYRIAVTENNGGSFAQIHELEAGNGRLRNTSRTQVSSRSAVSSRTAV